VTKKLDQIFADTWNSTDSPQKCAPEHFWPFCRMLSNAGILAGNEQDVAALEIGPFKIVKAYEDDERVLRILFETLPAIIDVFSGNATLERFVAEVLPVLSEITTHVVQKSARITDPLEWWILTKIRMLNKNGVYPNDDELFSAYLNDFSGSPLDKAALLGYRESLESVPPILGRAPLRLLNKDVNGRLSALF
jgi:hypothetical protein